MSSVKLDDLPVEIFEQITQYLSLKECARLERVNSKWRNAMQKEWRRVKIVDFYDDPLFSGIIDFLNNKNDESASVDLGTVCLQELAAKIHNHMENIRISRILDNRHVLAFLQKLSELSTPKLTTLTFERLCENFNKSYANVMNDIAQCIPLTLESLKLIFWRGEDNAYKHFFDGFFQQTFTQLKILDVYCEGPSFIAKDQGPSFKMNALKTPNLKELILSISTEDETDIDIDNLDQLTDLETLQLVVNGQTNEGSSLWKTLEAITSHDCKFLHTLKKLVLLGASSDDELLSQIGRFSALEFLRLPLMGYIDTAGQLRICRSICQGCANLKSLYLYLYDSKVRDEALIEVADGLHNLCFLYLRISTGQQIESFVNRLSVDRCMEIYCCIGPPEAEVQASGILNSHPNIRYAVDGRRCGRR